MAVAWVREKYAERWVEYVEVVAGKVDDWRDSLATHYPTLARTRKAPELVPEARAAVVKLLAMLMRRRGEFVSESSRSGPMWNALCDEHAASCVAVLRVSVKLTAAVTSLVRDEASLPSRVSTLGTGRLNWHQREYLQRAEVLISDRAGRLLAQAEAVFSTGERLRLTNESSYLADDGQGESTV